MATRSKTPSPDVIAHNAAKYTLVTGASSSRPASRATEQRSPAKPNGSKTTTKRKEEKATPELVNHPENNGKRSSRRNLSVALRSSSKADGQVEDPALLRRENKRLTEENTLLKAEVEYWRAKAKERHAKCVKLKAIMNAVRENIDGPSDEDDSADEDAPKKVKLIEGPEPHPTKIGKEPDFTKATITWEERELPKSRFDESMRAKLIEIPVPHQALASLALTQSTRRPDPVILPSPLKGAARRDRSTSPTKIAPLKYPHPPGGSFSPTKQQSSPSKPRWN